MLLPVRLLIVAAVAAVTVLIAVAPAFAQEEEGQEQTEETTTTVAATGLEPAVPVQFDEEETAATLDWTYRYMIPTALLVAVAIIVITSIRYFSDVVRKRYRVIEE